MDRRDELAIKNEILTKIFAKREDMARLTDVMSVGMNYRQSKKYLSSLAKSDLIIIHNGNGRKSERYEGTNDGREFQRLYRELTELIT